MLRDYTEFDHGGNMRTDYEYSVILVGEKAVMELKPPREDSDTTNWEHASTGEAIPESVVAKLVSFSKTVLVRVHVVMEGPDIQDIAEWVEYDQAKAEQLKRWAEEVEK